MGGPQAVDQMLRDAQFLCKSVNSTMDGPSSEVAAMSQSAIDDGSAEKLPPVHSHITPTNFSFVDPQFGDSPLMRREINQYPQPSESSSEIQHSDFSVGHLS